MVPTYNVFMQERDRQLRQIRAAIDKNYQILQETLSGYEAKYYYKCSDCLSQLRAAINWEYSSAHEWLFNIASVGSVQLIQDPVAVLVKLEKIAAELTSIQERSGSQYEESLEHRYVDLP